MKHLKTFEQHSFDSEESLSEKMGLFNKKELSPEESYEKGKKELNSHPSKVKVYKHIVKTKGKDVANKFVQFVGINGWLTSGQGGFEWDEELNAPDGTKGFYKKSTKSRSTLRGGGSFS